MAVRRGRLGFHQGLSRVYGVLGVGKRIGLVETCAALCHVGFEGYSRYPSIKM